MHSPISLKILSRSPVSLKRQKQIGRDQQNWLVSCVSVGGWNTKKTFFFSRGLSWDPDVLGIFIRRLIFRNIHFRCQVVLAKQSVLCRLRCKYDQGSFLPLTGAQCIIMRWRLANCKNPNYQHTILEAVSALNVTHDEHYGSYQQQLPPITFVRQVDNIAHCCDTNLRFKIYPFI